MIDLPEHAVEYSLAKMSKAFFWADEPSALSLALPAHSPEPEAAPDALEEEPPVVLSLPQAARPAVKATAAAAAKIVVPVLLRFTALRFTALAFSHE